MGVRQNPSAPSRARPASSDLDEISACELVTALMAIPGRSGEEAAVMAYLHRELDRMGIAPASILHDDAHLRAGTKGQVGNLIVHLPGTKRAPRRLLMAHVDTVPLCAGAQPRREGEWIRSADPNTALGGDDRAGAAVLLQTLREIVQGRLEHPPLTFVWVVQEEVGLLGSRHLSLSRLKRPKLCFNFDGGAPNVAVIGATGDEAIEIEIRGIASHAGAHPEGGVSAAAVAALAIAQLVNDGWHGAVIKGRQTGTSNVGVISGGEATNVVMPVLKLRAEARSHNPRFRTRIVSAYRRAFETAARAVTNAAGQTAEVTFANRLKYESFRLSSDEPCVAEALAAIRAVGLPAQTRVCNGGLDANWLTAHGYPTVTLGCGQEAIHTVAEALHVPSYLQACRIARYLATV